MKSDKTFPSVLVTLIILSAIFFVIERMAGRGRNRVQMVIHRGRYPENFGIYEPMPKGHLWGQFAWILRCGKKVDPA